VIVVDSSVWIDYFNNKRSAQVETLDKLLSEEILIVGDIILVEVLQGFRKDRDFREARKIMEQCVVVPMLGAEVAIKAAENYRKLRKSGLTVRGTVDVIIATFCVCNNLRLLYSDKDFNVIKKSIGLKSV
jgi:predicted nucleic acid-binding protein